MNKPYYLGLDIGTSSVGWALTDQNYELIRLKGKDAWGSRLFQEAETAEERRTERTKRRGKQREKSRLKELQKIFLKPIQEQDKNFFQRLEDSPFVLEDKKVSDRFTLFNDSDFTDKEFYENYPTISHLNCALLMESEKAFDVRLLFLAIHQKFKHRGHFLNEGLSVEGTGTLSSVLAELDELMEEAGRIQVFVRIQPEIEKILSDQTLNSTEKKDALKKVTDRKDKPLQEMIKLICGQSSKLKTVFPDIILEDDESNLSISFKAKDIDTILTELDNRISENEQEILLNLHRIYDWSQLISIMKDGSTGKNFEYLSQARVAAYEKHKEELRELKKLVKKYNPELHRYFFREMNQNNYSHYVGSTMDGKKRIRTGKASQDEFYKNVKKILKPVPDTELAKARILKEIDQETYLQKQSGSLNSVIPMQIQLKELKKILLNQEKYHPFLLEKDESGLTASQRIIELFTFHIPYYVGPLKNDCNGNGWAVRKQGFENAKIYPWNFDEVIDRKASADEFINRLLRSCTYLSDEKVLPADSLLYQSFKVLNELNNVKVNGQPLDQLKSGLRQEVYTNVFGLGNSVTLKALKKYLVNHGCVPQNEEVSITGVDGKFNSTLSSWKKFRTILSKEEFTAAELKMIENIIKWSLVYGDSKDFLEEKIIESYPDLSKKQIKKILSLKFKEWGRLSRAFLMLQGERDEAGNGISIIEAMWSTDRNLMELLTADSGFTRVLEMRQNDLNRNTAELSVEDLDGLYLSAPVKRMVWQTCKLIKEVGAAAGEAPQKVFVEMARGEDKEKKRTISRKKQLENSYQKSGLGTENIFKELQKFTDSDFQRRQLYLYFQQNGKDIYTGKPIDLDDLLHNNKVYDIDHIYPQSLVKDDSIENNLVLTNRKSNQRKTDKYPLDYEIQNRMESYWKFLRDHNLISQEKYNRLTRTSAFTDQELYGFVNRQLVETRQGTKAIANYLRALFPKTEIVYVKAGNVSAFRYDNQFPKCRKVNNLHHAKDAYLNIVVGNVYATKFRNFFKNGRFNPENVKYHMAKMFDYTVISTNGNYAWKVENGKKLTLETVKKVMSKNTPIVTRRSFMQKGSFSKKVLTNAQKAKQDNYFPVKTSDKRFAKNIKTYGGYANINGSHFFLVEHSIKGKRQKSFEFLPVYLAQSIKTEEQIEAYCKDVLGLVQPKVLIRKIEMYSRFKINGFFYYLTGRTNQQLVLTNATELILSHDSMCTIQKIERSEKNGFEILDKSVNKEKLQTVYEELRIKHRDGIFGKKVNPIGTKLDEKKECFEKLSLQEQAKTIIQILKLSATSEKSETELNCLGLGICGSSRISKTIQPDKYSEFILIHQSPSGLYENRINLLSL